MAVSRQPSQDYPAHQRSRVSWRFAFAQLQAHVSDIFADRAGLGEAGSTAILHGAGYNLHFTAVSLLFIPWWGWLLITVVLWLFLLLIYEQKTARTIRILLMMALGLSALMTAIRFVKWAWMH